jgi:shikimate dehydrogenase
MTSPALQEVVALLGWPAAGNPAQYLFERMIDAAGLDWRFLTLDVEPGRVREALAGAAAMGFRGCLLEEPLRTAAVGHVGGLTPAASFAAAVGLVERQPAGLVGHMTDGRGVVEAVRAHVDPTGVAVLLLGAGPTGRATGLELALAGAGEIVVCDRDADAAADLARSLAGVGTSAVTALAWDAPLRVPDRVAVLISTNAAEASPPPVLDGLRPDLYVADMALESQPAALVAAARAAGACAIDGLEIHAARTAIDFRLLAGVDADVEMLRESLDEFLST